jgi:hypothetical protein
MHNIKHGGGRSTQALEWMPGGSCQCQCQCASSMHYCCSKTHVRSSAVFQPFSAVFRPFFQQLLHLSVWWRKLQARVLMYALCLLSCAAKQTVRFQLKLKNMKGPSRLLAWMPQIHMCVCNKYKTCLLSVEHICKTCLLPMYKTCLLTVTEKQERPITCEIPHRFFPIGMTDFV